MAEEVKYAPDVERRLVKDEPGKKDGQLRLVWVWGDEDGRFAAHFDVKDIEEATNLVKRLAAEQVNDDTIDFNMHGLEVWEMREWTEWYSPDGDSLDELMENEIDPDGPLDAPPVEYIKTGPAIWGNWKYRLDLSTLAMFRELDNPKKYMTEVAKSLMLFMHQHKELRNDIELNWLIVKFFVLGDTTGMNQYEYDDRCEQVHQRLYAWADKDKLCWIVQS
jgi:hypothetical protein